MTFWAAVTIAAFLLASALYVAAEFAAVGVRRSRIRRLSEDGNWFARRLAPHIQSPVALDRYVGASQIGITISSLALGAFAQATLTIALAPFLADWFSLERLTAVSSAAAIVLIVLTAAQLVVGELVPKGVALQYPTETALATVLPMSWSLLVFRPVIGLLNGTAWLLLRALGIKEESHRHLHSPEEIDLLIAESRDGGLLEPEEHKRLQRALRLSRRTARELMVPLDRLTMLDAAADWDAIAHLVQESPFSRIPVFSGSRDAIKGVLHVKDLVERYALDGQVRLDRLVRPAIEVGENLAADRVLAELRDARRHSAVVVSVERRAIGLITIQDVLGELFGQTQPSGNPRPNPRRDAS
jgi:CBS domain containing-hemolysin-like protein